MVGYTSGVAMVTNWPFNPGIQGNHATVLASICYSRVGLSLFPAGCPGANDKKAILDILSLLILIQFLSGFLAVAIERRGFFSVPLLLWHWVSVYFLREPVTLTPIAERLAVELSLRISTTLVCHCWDSNTQPSACGPNTLTHCATARLRTIFSSHVSWPLKLSYPVFVQLN